METAVGLGHVRKPGNGHRSLAFIPGSSDNIKKEEKKNVGYLRCTTVIQTAAGQGHVRKAGHGQCSLTFIPGCYGNIMITLKFIPDIFGLHIYGYKNHSAFNEC